MNREQKKALVAELNEVFKDASLAVVVHYTGMTVAEVSELRAKMRPLKASLKVTKNRLTRLALSGTAYEDLADMFVGPTALAYSKDPIAAAKAVAEFAKTNEKLVIIGGVMNGRKMSPADIKTLASLPSLDELRGKIVGLIQAPASKIARVVQAPAGQVARVIGAYATKG